MLLGKWNKKTQKERKKEQSNNNKVSSTQSQLSDSDTVAKAKQCHPHHTAVN